MKEYLLETNENISFIWKRFESEERWHCWGIRPHNTDWKLYKEVTSDRPGVETDQLKKDKGTLQELTEEEVFVLLL